MEPELGFRCVGSCWWRECADFPAENTQPTLLRYLTLTIVAGGLVRGYRTLESGARRWGKWADDGDN